MKNCSVPRPTASMAGSGAASCARRWASTGPRRSAWTQHDNPQPVPPGVWEEVALLLREKQAETAALLKAFAAISETENQKEPSVTV
jgi:hypothetical protein